MCDKKIKTNFGILSIEDYKELRAYSLGYDSYSDMVEDGIYIDDNDLEEYREDGK